LERLGPTWHVATVRAVHRETPRAATIVLDVDGWPGHLAGQHVDLRLTAEDGYQAQRAYSIASSPEDPNLALTVERIDDGEVSPYLTDELRAGDRLEVRGPIGGYFTWRVEDGGPLVLVAGGSGIVPLAAMLRHRADASSDVAAALLVSARTANDVLYADELERHRALGVDVRCTLTREQPDGWSGWTGRVHAEQLLAIGAEADRQPRVYVCGPTGFVEHVADLLVGLGHDPHAIKAERFGASGSGANGG
jgi:ferredoxin-NADP reductase